jgi:hypothetical protein
MRLIEYLTETSRVISDAIILSEDEAEAIMIALGLGRGVLWSPARIAELQAIAVGHTTAFQVIDAIRMELRRRRESDET